MSNVVNLNRFRKKQKRAAKEKHAEENRAKYGRTKTDQQGASFKEAAQERRLDAHKREDDNA